MKNTQNDQMYLKSLGQHIRLLREEKGWSQEMFAFHCELHRTYVGAVERGERNISILNLRKIAIALDMPVSQILAFNKLEKETIIHDNE